MNIIILFLIVVAFLFVSLWAQTLAFQACKECRSWNTRLEIEEKGDGHYSADMCWKSETVVCKKCGAREMTSNKLVRRW